MRKVFLDTNVILDYNLDMQYFSAKSAEVDCIVTRNVKDYAFSELPVLTPQEFLAEI